MLNKCLFVCICRQHWNEAQMNSNELFSDIVSYAPDLAMVTSKDDVTTAQNKISMFKLCHVAMMYAFISEWNRKSFDLL